MKRLTLICVLAILWALPTKAQQKVARGTALTSAKNLMVTTTSNTTYYYLVSSNDVQMIHLTPETVRIGYDTFAKSKVKSMRFHALPRLLLDEDSTTFNKTATLDYGLVALKRDFALNQWNSLVLPFELTGTQIRDAFGEDALVATIRGISEDDQTAIEFQTLELTDDVVMKANYHYLIRPTKEADFGPSNSVSGFANARVKGPIYLFPNVSMKANQSARYQTYKSDDETTQIRFRGTYLSLDGSTTKNKKLAPGAYTMDDESHQFVLHEDSVSLRAFRSWIQDLSNETRPLKFYVDGVEMTDGIEGIPATDLRNQKAKDDEGIYDLAGRRVATPSRKGIYIIYGKKVAVR